VGTGASPVQARSAAVFDFLPKSSAGWSPRIHRSPQALRRLPSLQSAIPNLKSAIFNPKSAIRNQYCPTIDF
jgi:hypothetical protein